jgi:hypothetical protein
MIFQTRNRCTALARALVANATIRTLCLRSNAIGSAGGTALAEALLSPGACGALTALDSSNCDLGATGMAALARAVAGTTRLQQLDLSHNNGHPHPDLANISHSGAPMFAPIL